MMFLRGVIFGMISYLLTAGRCEVVTEVFAELGSQAVLPCKCREDSCHPADIIWSQKEGGTIWRKQSSGLQYFGAKWLKKEGPRVQCPYQNFQRGEYDMQIKRVEEDDAGLYVCRIRLGDQTRTAYIILRIIKVSTIPSAPVSGDNVEIRCDVNSWPRGASIQWLLNDNLFVNQQRTSNSFKSPLPENYGRVVSKTASEELTGKWTCAIYHNNNKWQASTTLSVKGIIQPSKDDEKMYAAVGSTFTQPCVFSPGLFPTSTVWEKLGESERTSDNRHATTLTWNNSIEISEVLFEDRGKYRCAGSVRGKNLTRTMQLVIAKVIRVRNENSEILSCQLSDSSEVTDYEWLHVTYDSNETKSVGPVQKGQTVLLTENSGEWICQYYGKNGILGNVTYQASQMSGHSGQKISGSSSNIWVIIGLSFFLLILLLILAQMYKNHQRRKRIFQYPALETIVHTNSNEKEKKENNQIKK